MPEYRDTTNCDNCGVTFDTMLTGNCPLCRNPLCPSCLEGGKCTHEQLERVCHTCGTPGPFLCHKCAHKHLSYLRQTNSPLLPALKAWLDTTEPGWRLKDPFETKPVRPQFTQEFTFTLKGGKYERS